MNTNMYVLVDMDGVIADFDLAFKMGFESTYPDRESIPFESRRTFYPADDYNKKYPDIGRNNLKKIYESKGFFRNLKPIAGAKEALNEMKAEGYNVFLCTAPVGAYENCVLEKFQWVEENLGAEWVERIILTSDKTMIKGAVLIDDKPKITGCNDREWKHIVFDQPYNRDITDQDRLVNWSDWKNLLNK